MGRSLDGISKTMRRLLGAAVVAVLVLMPVWPHALNRLGRILPLQTARLVVPEGAVRVATYGAPALDIAGPDVHLTNAVNRPAGVILRLDRPGAADERMVLAFDLESALPVVLKRYTGDDASKGQAVAGPNRILLDPGDTRVRLTIMDRGTFTLKDVRLIPCREPYEPECRTDDELVTELSAAENFPRGAKDLELARYLLDWGANSADFDSGDTLNRMEGIFSALSAAEIYYQYYVSNRLAGFCSSIATFQDKLFRAFDLDSFTITFGARTKGQDISHTAVVVRDRDSKRFFIMDPTFNLYFVDALTKRALDIEDMLTLPAERIGYVSQLLDRRDFLLTKKEHESGKGADCREGYREGRNPTVVCPRPNYDFNLYLASNAKGLAAVGIKPDISAYPELIKRGVFFVGEGSSSPADDDFIDLLKSHGIVYAAEGDN